MKICSEQPTPISEDIMNIWTEGYLKGIVLRKYRRQINSALALASFKSNKENVHGGYNPSLIIQVTPYMNFGALYSPTETQPKSGQIYLYNPANIGDESRMDIRMNHLLLPSSMSEA